MRNSLKYGFTAIAFAFVITFAACDDKEILKRMEAHSKALKTLRADMTIDVFNSQLLEHDISKGKLIYLPMKNNNVAVRFDFISPQQESLAVINNQFVLYTPKLKQAYIGSLSKGKISEEVSEALAFMNVSKKQLKANYNIKYLGEEKIGDGIITQHLEFTPKIVKSYYKKAEIWADKDGTPIQMKVVQHNEDTTTILFSNIEKNVTIKGSVFQINLPKDTKIIKN